MAESHIAAGLEPEEEIEQAIREGRIPEFRLCEEWMRKAEQEEDRERMGKGHYYLAHYYILEENYEKIEYHAAEAVRLMGEKEQEEKFAKAYGLLGILAHNQNNMLLAVENYRMAMHYCAGEKKDYCRWVVMKELADVFYRIKDYDKAVQYYEESARLYEEVGRVEGWSLQEYVHMLAAQGYCLLEGNRYYHAVKIEREIQKIYRESLGGKKSRMAVFVFEAAIQLWRGEKEGALASIDNAIEALKAPRKGLTRFNTVQDLLDYLVRTKDTCRMSHVLDYLESKIGFRENDERLSQLYLYRLCYCRGEMSQDKYLVYSRRFFSMRQKYEAEENTKFMSALEMKFRLQAMRDEEQKIDSQNQIMLKKTLHDELTGLPNRRYFDRRVEEMFREASETETAFAVVLIDVDYFKEYNDQYGHQQGDVCLGRIGEVLRRQMGEQGFCARYGGDEFVLLFVDRTTDQIKEILEAIKSRLKVLSLKNENTPMGYVTVTQGGINRVTKSCNRPWDFLTVADQRLLFQKGKEKGEYCLTEELRI